MAVEVKAPAMGESVSEIYIGQWHKSEGDEVRQDEPLVELESDKATLELAAPAAGVLKKIVKQTGDAAEVGDVIGLLDDSAESATSHAGAIPETAPPEQQRVSPEKAEKGAHADESQPKEPRPPVNDGAGSSTARKAHSNDACSSEDQSAERRTRQQHIAATDGHDAADSREGESTAGIRDDSHQRQETDALRPPVAAAPDRREERSLMTPLRRRIAERLVAAQQQAALLTTFNEVDMTEVKRLRKAHGEAFEKMHGVRLGFMSFFVKAVIEALRQCRELNAIIDGDEIVYRDYFDIGVAVSTQRGLVVPVLRNAEAMSFKSIEQAIERLATRARDSSLTVEELQGGTFTITNGGVFGSLLSTPLVNPPQSGVLGMHAIQDRPVAQGGQVVIKPMMYVALTYDHRIVDGREAVTFLKQVKDAVESPSRLLLEV